MSLTIVVTCSFIPSHPSIQIVKGLLESLQYTNCDPSTPIILAHDYNNNPMYKKYLDNLHEYTKNRYNIQIVVRENHGCLTGNVRNALQYVKTEFMLLLQHDLPFTRVLPDIYKVMADMRANPSLKHVRFNRLVNTHNMYDKFYLFGKQVSGPNYSYTRTPGWSDNNHLCLTSYYNDLIMKECPDGTFMEGHLYWKIHNEESHEKYGTYLFGPLDEPPYTGHSDGRFTNSRPRVVILSNCQIYKTIIEQFSDKFNFQVFNPDYFFMHEFKNSVRDADVCLTDFFYYKDIISYISPEYHIKFNLICSKVSETHYYGSQIVSDAFSISVTDAELQSKIKRQALLLRINVMEDWCAMFKHMIHKQKAVRIYTMASFDLFNYGHSQAFCELKRKYPKSIVLVGILKDVGAILSHEERITSVRDCKYVDEVCTDPPIKITEDFLTTYNIDIVASETMDFSIPCSTIIPIHYTLPNIVERINNAFIGQRV